LRERRGAVSFFAELKRRNVIRMAGLYLVGAWLAVQVADTLLPVFEAPEWVMKALVGLLALGLVPTLIFSWVFELTPQGLKREQEVDRSQSITDVTARRLDIAVIVLLLIVGALMLRGPSTTPDSAAPPAAGTATEEAPTEAQISDKSIAVLPFADFSPGGDQGWFADGLAEEILNSLARTPDLLVSARTSSFKYKGSELGVPQIAAELGVAHVLEGSVRSATGRVRVTAQLIRASDGFHLWSQTYDREAADVIAIQEELATAIALAMQTSMDPQALAGMAAVGTRSVEAYQAYLQGIVLRGELTREGAQRAYELFEQARSLDPAFAAAHARAADYWLTQLDPTNVMTGSADIGPEAMRQRFAERSDLAIRHASTEPTRLEYRAQRASYDLRLREAVELYRRLVDLRPLNTRAWAGLVSAAIQSSDHATANWALEQTWSQALRERFIADLHLNDAHRVHDRQRAADAVLEIMAQWPDDPAVLYQVHRTLLWAGRVEAARSVYERWRGLVEGSARGSPIPVARQECAEGRRAPVEAALADVPDEDLSTRWALLMLLGRHSEAAELLQPLEQSGRIYALAGFLSYPQFDPRPFPSLMQVLEREKVERPPPEPIPFACPPAEGQG
jgi:TolB-like protein